MLPPLKTVEAGLHRATEALAMELAHPGQATPDWDSLHWRLASAAAAAPGVSPLLSGRCRWQYPPWQRFLHEQHAHVEPPQRRILPLLELIHAAARSPRPAAVPSQRVVPHDMGVAPPGARTSSALSLPQQQGE